MGELLPEFKMLQSTDPLSHKPCFYECISVHNVIKLHLDSSQSFTFVPSSLCQLHILGVWLKDPNSPSADPLHRRGFISLLRQTRDLGGRSRHTSGHNSSLYTCNDKRNALACFTMSICMLIILKIKCNLTTRLGPSMVGHSSTHFSRRH